MKTKSTCIIILAILMIISCIFISGCKEDNNTDTSSSTEKSETSEISNENESSGEESQILSEESSEESEVPVEKTWPHVSGTFVQPGAFMNYTVKSWENHFKNLKEVGIDIFIVQWTAETPYGKFSSIYYPSEIASKNKAAGFYDGSTFLPAVLEAAEKVGMKVFVGLNLSDEWWSIAVTDSSWNKYESDLGVEMAKEIYSLYKEEYPNALYGWYFAYEMCNGMKGYEKQAGEFINMYRKPLYDLDPTMPMMMSPFVTQWGCNAVKAGEEWTKVFQTAEFYDGDIFCCQDAVGAGHITIDQLDGYFSNLKKACDTEEGLLFWANSENFTSDYQSAPLTRFIRQMEIAKPYVSGYVTFAYSHYYAKDYNGKIGYHRAYKKYYDTGKLDLQIESPELSYEISNGKVVVGARVKNNDAGIQKVVFEVAGGSTYDYNIPIGMIEKEECTVHYNIMIKDGDQKYKVKVTAIDYCGNQKSANIEIEVK